MMRLMIGLFTGGLFGVGLVIARMTDPNRILGFLDVFGHWDPRLGFVMVGAIAVHAPFVAWSRRRTKPIWARSMHLPVQSRVDGRLVLGAALFGVGWGLAGYCPAPALVSASTNSSALLLTLAMLGGMLIHDGFLGRRVPRAVSAHLTTGTEQSQQAKGLGV